MNGNINKRSAEQTYNIWIKTAKVIIRPAFQSYITSVNSYFLTAF